jgi:molybdate transport system substrate-binding protein
MVKKHLRMALWILALTGPALSAPISVLAAASLTDVLPQVGALWKAKGKGEATFVFDGSSRLAKQIEQGVPADVFFSADVEWMDYLDKAKKIDPSTRKNPIFNELVLIVPSNSSLLIKGPADLRSPKIMTLALAGENVPISRYAQAALEHLGIWKEIQPKVVRGDNVRVALHWVASGNANAGVVYRTDALSQKQVRIVYTFPANSYPKVTYATATVTSSKHGKEARDFVTFCESSEAQQIFAKAGFLPAKPVSP